METKELELLNDETLFELEGGATFATTVDSLAWGAILLNWLESLKS